MVLCSARGNSCRSNKPRQPEWIKPSRLGRAGAPFHPFHPFAGWSPIGPFAAPVLHPPVERA